VKLLAPALLLGFLFLAGCGSPVAVLRHNVRYLELLRQPSPEWLPVPVEGVSAARLYDSWGDARDGGARHHEGIDIFAKRNTPVRSATAGVIEAKAERGLGGRTVFITGPGGYRHYYAHLEAWGEQAVGDWVEAGDVIGYVGNSGNAAGGPTHLHYGIYAPVGGAINPYPLLKAVPPPPPPPAPATPATIAEAG